MTDELVVISISRSGVYHRGDENDATTPSCRYGKRETTYIRTLLEDVEGFVSPCQYCHEGYNTPIETTYHGGPDGTHALDDLGKELADMDPDDFGASP